MIQFGNDKIVEIYVGSDKIKEVYHGNDLVYSSAVQDGYWIHKDTGVKTYFGSDADFIVDGVMNTPAWMPFAKEIRLCTGITELKVETFHFEHPEWGDFDVNMCTAFAEGYAALYPYDTVAPYNTVLEKLDFGGASISNVPSDAIPPLSDENGAHSSLEEVVLNDNVTSIGSGAFSNCSSLTSIELPNVTTIGSNAFSNCNSLTSIELPNVTTIEGFAFSNCISLTSIELPNVTTTGDSAFYNCDSLAVVDIGTSVTSMDYYPFYYCSSLSLVYIRAVNPPSGDWRSTVIDPIPSGLQIKVPPSSVDAYKAAVSSTYRNYITSI